MLYPSSSAERTLLENPSSALAIAIPPRLQNLPEGLAILAVTYQYHLLCCLTRKKPTANMLQDLSNTLDILQEPGNMLQWQAIIEEQADEAAIKKSNQVLLATYSLLLKATSLWEAENNELNSLQVFQLRIFACKCFQQSTLFKSPQSMEDGKRIESYWIQLRKICVLFLRSNSPNSEQMIATLRKLASSATSDDNLSKFANALRAEALKVSQSHPVEKSEA